MTALQGLDCPVAVTAYLCCTDNMPSGSAMKLGDVLTMRDGLTVEVLNTDAEGRLVMADGLCLAVEDGVDAIVDIATLTGACLRALGVEVAGVMGNSAELVVDQVTETAGPTDEPVWQLPLDRRYRRELDSPIADISNLGGANAGAITAALFLAEFVGGTALGPHRHRRHGPDRPADCRLADRRLHRLRRPLLVRARASTSRRRGGEPT